MRFREPKSDPPRVPAKPHREGWVTQVREYELITPLFGGGVKAGTVDPITPISGKGIRGQLRFWWRATRGGYFGGRLKMMKRVEDDLWGSAGTHADQKQHSDPVQLAVELLNKGKIFNVTRKDSQNRRISVPIHDMQTPYGYVAFPLREAANNAAVYEGIRFRLTVAYPERRANDVEAALWAWETFGGVGARTRRGFGAVQVVKIDGVMVEWPECNLESVRKAIRAGFRYCRKEEWIEDVPHLTKRIAVTKPFSSPITAWEDLIKALRDFRQYRDGYEATEWPEPNAIRKLEGKAPLPQSPHVDKFPRAALGLPILFEFPQEKGALPKVTLTGNEVDRLASPLVIRPYRCRGGKAVGIALVLQTERSHPSELVPGGLKLDGISSPSPRFPIDHSLTATEATDIPPLENNNPDVVEEFLNFLSARSNNP